MDSDDPEALRLTSHAFPARPGAKEERCYLLVLDGDSSQLYPLPERGSVVIGRAPDADLRLSDSAISRHHAQLTLGGGATLTDLGSRHGVRINGEPLSGPRALASGDVIALGGATLVLHRSAPPEATRPLLDLPRLRRRLEEEIERALRYGRQAALLCLDLGGPAAVVDRERPIGAAVVDRERPMGAAVVDRARVAAALSDHLRLIDVVGATGGEVWVLLPELSGEALQAAAERLQRALRHLGPVRAGVARCPDDGCDADTLLCGARAALPLSRDDAPGAAGAAATTLDLGGTAVIVADPAMLRLYDLIRKLAHSALPVLVSGETGVGKELAAQAIHHFSRRAGRPLLALNCAALPESLAESELFGHERGAFSGALTSKPGLFEAAHEGTLFLDEVGELPLTIQAKLLRVLESGRLHRVGEVRERSVDVRVIAASNRDLAEEVKAGRFRQDLLFRLGAARVTLPPLRDRTRELPMLARSLLAAACARAGRGPLAIGAPAMGLLCAHRWPGNVRELRNAMDYAVATCGDNELLEPWHLPEDIAGLPAPAPAPPKDEEAAPPASSSFRPIEEEVRELERARMAQALAAAGGVQTRAAELIGMPLRTFVTKLGQYQLPRGRQGRTGK